VKAIKNSPIDNLHNIVLIKYNQIFGLFRTINWLWASSICA
jgi:hypothetical protein